jgi:hypothetical protein
MVSLALGILPAPGAISQEAVPVKGASVPSDIEFTRDIQPVFKERCISCHGEKKAKGRLRLDSKAAAMKGGVTGVAIVPGSAQESRLVSLLVAADPDERMPKDAPPLPAKEIALLRAWIERGAVWPESASAPVSKAEPHWAYVRPTRPAVPEVRENAWVRNPIDAFVAQEREARGLSPRPEASRSTLLRRVTLDLVGLPPTPDELHAFLADPAPDAYEKVVDRLLADPRYGERWGRHWMDVWRYSDMSEFEQNQILSSQRHLWRWRDWIVDSLNADKGYDRMILEMLAGDEISPLDPGVLRATGFLARNYYKLNRNVWLDNAVEHTSKAFLATTLNCARCHNHFFDPLLQEEYYRFRAFYEPYDVRTDPVPGEVNPDKDGLSRVFDLHPDDPTYLFIRGEDRSPDKTRSLTPAVPKSLSAIPVRIEPVPLPSAATAPGKQEFVRRDLEKAAEAELSQARARIETALGTIMALERTLTQEGLPAKDGEKARRDLESALDGLPALIQGVPLAEARRDSLRATLHVERLEETGGRSGEPFQEGIRKAQAAERRLAVLEGERSVAAARHALLKAPDDKKRAEARKKLAEADQALSRAQSEATKPLTGEFTRRPLPSYPSQSTGRRLALARWIVNRENPLTARVAVNHVWMRHFGRALVPTAFDFGSQGERPSHPALLDWLAVELMDKEWSLKKLHRLIVTSAAYRMDSTPDPGAIARDPDDKYLWRMAPRRLEAEAVRDGILYVSGRLDPSRGGPELDESQGLASRRRSLYFRHNPEKRVEFLAIFDGPAATECYTRTHTIVPQQALALLNSSLALDAAQELARRLPDTAGKDPAETIRAAFEAVLSRTPTKDELEECRRFLSESGPTGGLAALIHVLLNHHEFVTIR